MVLFYKFEYDHISNLHCHLNLEKMYLLQHLFNNWYRDLSLDKMSAAAVVTGLVIFLLILGLWKAWGKGGAE